MPARYRLATRGFFAIGGYTTAVLSTVNLLPLQERAPGRHALGDWPDHSGEPTFGEARRCACHPGCRLARAVMASAIIAYGIGMPVLRLKGHYLAMATLGFGIIIYRIALGTPLFGAADGLSDVPPFPFFAGLALRRQPGASHLQLLLLMVYGPCRHDSPYQPDRIAGRKGACGRSTATRRRRRRWESIPAAISFTCSLSAR